MAISLLYSAIADFMQKTCCFHMLIFFAVAVKKNIFWYRLKVQTLLFIIAKNGDRVIFVTQLILIQSLPIFYQNWLITFECVQIEISNIQQKCIQSNYLTVFYTLRQRKTTSLWNYSTKCDYFTSYFVFSRWAFQSEQSKFDYSLLKLHFVL